MYRLIELAVVATATLGETQRVEFARQIRDLRRQLREHVVALQIAVRRARKSRLAHLRQLALRIGKVTTNIQTRNNTLIQLRYRIQDMQEEVFGHMNPLIQMDERLEKLNATV